MIKAMEVDKSVERKIAGVGSFFRTTFVCDNSADITTMNSANSEFLNYPAGSAVINTDNGKVYVLNARENEYKEI